MKMLYDKIKGISIINPDEVEEKYYNHCIDYAINNNYNHIQITGPIHDSVKGNIDGMILNKKYSQFNNEKDVDYVNLCIDVINKGLERSNKAGIKTFMWHHELILPTDFGKEYPEILNENGDVEITHPIVKDYLENKIADFFDAYPLMDGIVLTLHETKIPLLKLKNQKLDKIDRVKYVTKIIYDSCKKFGKALIVRPYASLEKDQEMMLKAYSEISKSLIVMDKWTKFDWSLSLPDNDFFAKITDNPFIVEGDIFGEYFGQGRLPIMFCDHIKHKFIHCNTFDNSGFVLRIDRNYQNAFNSVNEVNLVTASALLNGLNVDEEIDKFFAARYGEYGDNVKKIMEKTENNQKKIFYINGYYFTQGSYFPEVNHAKNHFFFEIMKDNYCIASNEWFIPVGWKRISLDSVIREKQEAEEEAGILLKEVEALEDKLKEDVYIDLWVKFKNLDYVAKIWNLLLGCLYNYVKYFEYGQEKYETELYSIMNKLDEIHKEGREVLGERFYNYYGARGFTNSVAEFNGDFVACLKANFQAEKETFNKLKTENNIDFIVCGGAFEGHKLQKEVNFSDTLLVDGKQCRIPGNKAGVKWSTINGHGWFSYELRVKENHNNKITFALGSSTDFLSVSILIADKKYTIKDKIKGIKEYTFDYFSANNNVRVRIDRVDANTPYLFSVKVR